MQVKRALPVAIALLTAGLSTVIFGQDSNGYRLLSESDWESFDVVAPVVPNTTVVVDKRVGQIVYDISAHQFKGLDDSDTWIALNNSGGSPIVSNGTSQRLESARLVSNGSTCSVTRASSSWITGGTRSGAGYCIWTIAGGVFSTAPVCTCTADNVGGAACKLNSDTSNTSVETQVFTTSAQAGADGGLHLICMGTHP